MKNLSPAQLKLLLLASTLLLGLGLFGPCMTVVPQFGEYSLLIKFLKPELGATQTVSIVSGVLTLLGEGKYFIGSVILVFSVMMMVYGWQMAAMQARTFQKTLILQIPLVYLYAILPLTGLLMFIRTLQVMYQDFRQPEGQTESA